jgi:hypothetical protein
VKQQQRHVSGSSAASVQLPTQCQSGWAGLGWAGLGFQWAKLVRVWSVTRRTVADYIYIYISPSLAPEADSRARLVRVCAP